MDSSPLLVRYVSLPADVIIRDLHRKEPYSSGAYPFDHMAPCRDQHFFPPALSELGVPSLPTTLAAPSFFIPKLLGSQAPLPLQAFVRSTSRLDWPFGSTQCFSFPFRTLKERAEEVCSYFSLLRSSRIKSPCRVVLASFPIPPSIFFLPLFFSLLGAIAPFFTSLLGVACPMSL